MCAVCGSGSARIDWLTSGVEPTASAWIQAHQQVAQTATRLLRKAGVEVHCNPGASTWTLRSADGSAATASTFTEILPAFEKLSGTIVSPLDLVGAAMKSMDINQDA